MPTPIRKPMRPLNEMIRLFASQAKESLTVNLQTQRIWPTEVYPGYGRINAARAAKGWSHSTGEGEKSLKVTPRPSSDVTSMRIDVSFNAYLRYVDIGVGAGTMSHDVQRSRKAYFSRRYDKWVPSDPSTGRPAKRVHRPSLLMECRHVLTRMRDYAVDFYGYEGTGYLIKTFESLEVEL